MKVEVSRGCHDVVLRERKKTKTVSFLPLNEAHLILSPITPFLSPHDLNNRYNGQIPDSRKMSLKYKMADRWEISREQVWEGWVTVTESIYRVFNDSLGSLVKFCYSGTRHLRRALIIVPVVFITVSNVSFLFFSFFPPASHLSWIKASVGNGMLARISRRFTHFSWFFNYTLLYVLTCIFYFQLCIRRKKHPLTILQFIYA